MQTDLKLIMMSNSVLFSIILVLGLTCVFASQPRIKPNPPNVDLKMGGVLTVIDGREYFFSEFTSLDRAASQTKCEEMNMTLISLETTVENTAVFDFIANNGSVGDYWRWTSGLRSVNDTDWWWTYSDGSRPQAFTETSWGIGQPDTPAGVDVCTDFLVYFQGWDDDQCDSFLMSYACEQQD
ncbi:hypothetical protein B566_EDAN012895 [Ephemera danica]|nr:hypothetical protein B566_EDAN012895 [Ephemera danica]